MKNRIDTSGWSAYTTRGDTKADDLASYLYDAAKFHLPGQRLRTDYADGDPDLAADFYILRQIIPPSVPAMTATFCYRNPDSRPSSIFTLTG